MPQLLLPCIHHQVGTEPQGGSTYTLSIHFLIFFIKWHFFTANWWAGTQSTCEEAAEEPVRVEWPDTGRTVWRGTNSPRKKLQLRMRPHYSEWCWALVFLLLGLIKTKDQALSVGPLKVWSGTSLNGSMSYLITGCRWSTTTAPWCFNSLMQTNMFNFWICVICASNHVCESDLCYIYTDISNVFMWSQVRGGALKPVRQLLLVKRWWGKTPAADCLLFF